jgi:hypothetical protein
MKTAHFRILKKYCFRNVKLKVCIGVTVVVLLLLIVVAIGTAT